MGWWFLFILNYKFWSVSKILHYFVKWQQSYTTKNVKNFELYFKTRMNSIQYSKYVWVAGKYHPCWVMKLIFSSNTYQNFITQILKWTKKIIIQRESKYRTPEIGKHLNFILPLVQIFNCPTNKVTKNIPKPIQYSDAIGKPHQSM